MAKLKRRTTSDSSPAVLPAEAIDVSVLLNGPRPSDPGQAREWLQQRRRAFEAADQAGYDPRVGLLLSGSAIDDWLTGRVDAITQAFAKDARASLGSQWVVTK